MLSKTTRPSAFRQIAQRFFRGSPILSWRLPSSLSTDELNRQLMLRNIESSADWEQSVYLLEEAVNAEGGYANGLTTNPLLEREKMSEEEKSNQLSNSQYYETRIFAKFKYQLRIKKQFSDIVEITFNPNNTVKITGTYQEVCRHRQSVLDALAISMSEENMYSFSEKMMTEVMDHVKAAPTRSGMHNSVVRMSSSGKELYIATISGPEEWRNKACSSFENLLDKLKNKVRQEWDEFVLIEPKIHTVSTELGPGEWYTKFVEFQGHIFFIDSAHHAVLRTLKDEFEQLGLELEVKIHITPSEWLPWIRAGEIAIEGATSKMTLVRKRLDAMLKEARKKSAILVCPTELRAELRKLQKNLTQVDPSLGSMEVRFLDTNVEIHILGTTANGLNALMKSLDFFISRCANKTSDGILIEKRERMKNLNFVDIGIGGLTTVMKTMIRRTFESRLIPSGLRMELGLSHIKGCLFYGPPGTGKTLIARKVAEILGCVEPKLVNGPEVESKWVGEAEKKIRALFEDAEKEFEEVGQKSKLHVIIFDELDAIAKQRGGPHAKSRDGALNQLLCCLDGVKTLDNIIVFGLTNRKDCLDRALLRPGRLEVQLEIGAPDAAGRLEILNIHTKRMRESNRISDEVDLKTLSDFLDGFTGADIAGLVRSAVSFALDEADEDSLADLLVTANHFDQAIEECRRTKEAVEVEDLDKGYDGLFHA